MDLKELLNRSIHTLNKQDLDFKTWKQYYDLYYMIETKLLINERVKFIIALCMCNVLVKSTNETLTYAKLNDNLRVEYHGLSMVEEVYKKKYTK